MNLLVFLGCGITGFVILFFSRESPAAREPQENRLNVEVFRVGSENIRQTLRGFGTVQADRKVILSAEVAGTTDQLHPDFEIGLSVVARRYPDSKNGEEDQTHPLVEGDELLVIDQERYRGQLRQIESQFDELDAD